MKNKQAIMDLIGRVVMVDPELETTPASRKGEFCIIQDVRQNVSGSSITVAFEDSRTDFFMPDNLLILRSKRDILEALFTASSKNVNKTEYKGVLQILHLEASGHHRMALSQAMSGEFYKKQCVINCIDWVIKKEKQRLKKLRRTI